MSVQPRGAGQAKQYPLLPEAPVLAPGRTDAKPEASDLLAWYDLNRRDLPWRARPGEEADPYRVWLSEIMLQQTTVAAVKPYFAAFLLRFPTVDALASAPSEAVMSAWAGLGYYSRARNLHACAQVVAAEHGGRFPDTEDALRTLPGIGPYTAAAVAAIAFGRGAAAVDGNVERVVTRLFRVDTPLPGAKPLIRDLTQGLVPTARPGDFAQALMDLGATVCTPKRPACPACPWTGPCGARQDGDQNAYPVKAPKREGKLRRGAAFVAVKPDGSVLLRTREPKGLLGGMAETPTSAWLVGYEPGSALAEAPLPTAWRRLGGTVRHVFTHFPLELAVFLATCPADAEAPPGMRWTAPPELGREPLPNVMRKVLAYALGELSSGPGRLL